MGPNPDWLVSVIEEVGTHRETLGQCAQRQQEGGHLSICEPRIKALEETNPAETLISDFCRQNCEKITFWVKPCGLWDFVTEALENESSAAVRTHSLSQRLSHCLLQASAGSQGKLARQLPLASKPSSCLFCVLSPPAWLSCFVLLFFLSNQI